MKIRRVLYLIPVVALLFSASLAQGEIWIDLSAYGLSDLEAVLDPGDHFHLAFFTSGQFSPGPTSKDIGDYNTFVQDQARLDGSLTKAFTEDLGVVWNAIGSTPEVGETPAVHAKDNIGYSSSDVPVYLLNGIKIADSSTDMWDGTLDNALRLNQSGQYSNLGIATGSTTAGVLYSGYGLGDSEVRVGYSEYADSRWIDQTWIYPGSYPLSLYAFSGELVSGAIPEPSSFVALSGLLGMGLIALWRRRRAN